MALTSVPAPNAIKRPVARVRWAIGPASASPTYNDAEEKPPHRNAVAALMLRRCSLVRRSGLCASPGNRRGNVREYVIGADLVEESGCLHHADCGFVYVGEAQPDAACVEFALEL